MKSHSVYAVILVFLVLTIGQVRAFSGNINISGNNVIGGNVMVTCGWNLQANEAFFDLTIRPPNTSSNNYYFSINAGATSPGSLRSETKHAIVQSSFNKQSVSMSISGLQCTDDHDYGCFFTIIIGGNTQYPNSTSHLDVKVRPRVPVIGVSHTGTDILENTNITATCRANWGRRDRGGLRFVVYRNGNAENVPDTDPRIINKKNVPLNPGEEECSSRVEWTFRLQVSSADQNLIVACFVTNLDFPVDPVPTTCDNPSLQLCNKTDTLRIASAPTQATQTATTTAPASRVTEGHGKTFLGNVTITGNNVVGGSVTIKCSWSLMQNDILFDLTIRPANSPVFYFIANTCGVVVHGDLYDASRHTIDLSSFGARSVSMNISGLRSSDEHDYSCFFRVVNSHRFKFYDTISHLHVNGI